MSLNRETVMRYDPDRYLLSLFAPVRHRGALWALYAFNYEIAKTRELVSDTTMGLIRLQWWRDAIAEIYDNKPVRQHEVVEPLAEAIKKYDLPREPFDNLIYAREFDLEGVAPANVEGLLKYCEFTSAPLFDLTLRVLGQTTSNDTELVDVSIHFALIGVMRSVPSKLSQRLVLLPVDVMGEVGLSEEKLIDFKGKDLLPKAIKQIVEGVQCDFRVKHMPPFMRKVAHMTALYKAQLRRVDYDVFDARMSVAPRCMALRLWLGLGM